MSDGSVKWSSGWDAVPRVVSRSGRALSLAARWFWVTLNSYDEGFHPGIRRLSAEAGLDTRTAQAALRELQEKGMLSVITQGPRRRNLYRLHPETEWQLATGLPRKRKGRSVGASPTDSPPKTVKASPTEGPPTVGANHTDCGGSSHVTVGASPTQEDQKTRSFYERGAMAWLRTQNPDLVAAIQAITGRVSGVKPC